MVLADGLYWKSFFRFTVYINCSLMCSFCVYKRSESFLLLIIRSENQSAEDGMCLFFLCSPVSVELLDL